MIDRGSSAFTPGLTSGKVAVVTGGSMYAYFGGGEIGTVVAFLASDAASFITGAVLPVDGGYLVTGI